MARSNILGRVPTSYLGNTAVTPPNFHEYNRVPNQNDSKNFIIGDLWLYWDNSFTPRKPRLFFLASLAGTAQKTLIADWREFDFGAGGADLERITGDISTGFGTAQPVTGDPNNGYNIDMIGATDLQFDGDPATYSFQVTNKVKLTPYVVGPIAYQYRFTAIQDAIDQAVLDGANSNTQPAVVFITPGIYTEDLTLADGVYLVGHQTQNDRTASSAIIGTITATATGVYGLYSLSVDKTTAGDLINLSGANEMYLQAQNCLFRCSATADDVYASTATNIISNFTDCRFVPVASKKVFDIAAGEHAFDSCSLGDLAITPAASTLASVGVFKASYTFIIGSITATGINAQNIGILHCDISRATLDLQDTTTAVNVEQTRWSNDDQIAVTIDADSSVRLEHTNIFCNAAGGEWATGSGEISINSVSIDGTAFDVDGNLTRVGGKTFLNAIDLNFTTNDASGQGQIQVVGDHYFHTAGVESTYAGYLAGNLTNTGANNDAFGGSAGAAITTGERNLFLGRAAGNNYTTETDNVAIYSSGVAASSNQMWVGGPYGTGNYQTTDAYVTGRVRYPETNYVYYDATGVNNVTGDGTLYQIIFNTLVRDQRGDHNPVTGLTTISKAGVYYMWAKIAYNGIGAHDFIDCAFTINGAFGGRIFTINPQAFVGVTGGVVRLDGMRDAVLNVADTVGVAIIANTGAGPGAKTVGTGSCAFGVRLIV